MATALTHILKLLKIDPHGYFSPCWLVLGPIAFDHHTLKWFLVSLFPLLNHCIAYR